MLFLTALHAGNSDERLPGTLAGFTEAAFKKIPMVGAVSQKVGNAGVNVLAELPGLDRLSTQPLGRTHEVRHRPTPDRKGAGKALKGSPAYVKEHHGEGWKELQRAVKDMEKTQRAIPIETLRTCYLHHPLLTDMSRRLIWQFECGPGIWHDGRIIDGAEREIDLAAQTTARL
jgi:hypothetical protein